MLLLICFYPAGSLFELSLLKKRLLNAEMFQLRKLTVTYHHSFYSPILLIKPKWGNAMCQANQRCGHTEKDLVPGWSWKMM